MLEQSNRFLQNGYTITISSRQNNLQGSYVKRYSDGLHPYEISQEELIPLQNFPNLIQKLSEGYILQVTTPTLLLCGIIGKEETEGPYCENKCLEVCEQVYETNYYRLLSRLDAKLSLNESFSVPIQYKKSYKGESRYE